MIYGQVRKEVEKRANGTFANVVFEKQLKTLRDVTAKVEKHSEVVGRFGVKYDNIGRVQEKRELGILPSKNMGLPWGEWEDEGERYFINHKGEKYLRVSLVPNNKIKTTYYINGEEATREEAEKLCLATEFKKSSKPMDVITVNVKNIMAIR